MSKSSAKSYLVTGAAGFVGSRFVESCSQRGINLISVDHIPHFTTRHSQQSINFGEIVDRELLFQWLQKNHSPIHAIVHLGAITDTRVTDLTRLKKMNLDYSQNLWSYATQHKIPLIYASSAATYGDGKLGYDDDESLIPSLRPLNAYGDSKQQFDLWALAQEKAGNHPSTWVGFKFFNVYGWGEHHKGFMSSVILHSFEQIQKTGQVTLFKSHREGIADGFQKRDFVDVTDIVEALHFAIEKPIQRGIYNLGTGQARTYLDLARSVFRSLGKAENIQFIDTPLSIRDKYQYFTEAKMERLRNQGFKHTFASLENGVERYIKKLT
jgi:ADP-L-glycero-D-manno-heptose 6-epimerase